MARHDEFADELRSLMRMLQSRTQETGIAYGEMTACLSGSTLDGVPFNGCDSVRTVPDMD